MTAKSGGKFKLTNYDYMFLTDTWEGVKGAAFNCVYEDLLNAGLITRDGLPTEKGKAAADDYVPEPKQLSLGL